MSRNSSAVGKCEGSCENGDGKGSNVDEVDDDRLRGEVMTDPGPMEGSVRVTTNDGSLGGGRGVWSFNDFGSGIMSDRIGVVSPLVS